MQARAILFILGSFLLLNSSCYRDSIYEKAEWGDAFKKRGIDSASFEIYDQTHDQIFYWNKDRNSRRFSPASTFKIVNSLIALELNKAPDIEYVIPWDGKKRWNESWNQDLNMKQAFEYSAVPYYQALARKIGKEKMQHFIDTMNYGNKNTGDTVDQFWLDGSLRVTPDEQVGFLKRMYYDKLPLSKRSQRLVRTLMLREKTEEHKLSYKTGTTPIDGGYICQLVGYFEKKEEQLSVETKSKETNYRPYFFAMNFELKGDNIDLAEMSKMRLELAKEFFKDLEIL